MITIGLSSATSFCVNLIIITYSTTATAIYGIWLKLQNFCFMPIFGMNNGMIPILSYNYAQNQKERVRKTSNLAFFTCIGLMSFFMLVLEVFPSLFLNLFNASQSMLLIGIPAVRISVFSLPFAAVSLIRTTSMQALNYARYTLIVNILRQFLIIVPAFYILSFIFKDVFYLWFAIPLTEILCAGISSYFYHRMSKQIF